VWSRRPLGGCCSVVQRRCTTLHGVLSTTFVLTQADRITVLAPFGTLGFVYL